MTEENESDKKVVGGHGITAGRDVHIGDISGQVAIGLNITQTQTITQTTLSPTSLEDLRTSLLDFIKGIDKLELSSEDQTIVNGDITAAVKEAKKDKPEISKIKEKFESAINTIKGAGKIINDVSELYEPAKKIAKLVGLAISILI